MSISVPELVKRYPVLYHMASFGSWPSVKRLGLLSTSALVDLFEVPEPRRTALLTTQRHNSELIQHPRYGKAFLRDQKPLSEKNLSRCLVDCDSPTWYRTLNERVFFWLNRDRLFTLMSAREYSGKPHVVLELETSTLLAHYQDQIELAHMNTGNTRPFPHPRGLSTFRSLAQYPYEARKRLGDYSAIVELTVLGGVPQVREHVRNVEHGVIRSGKYRTTERLAR